MAPPSPLVVSSGGFAVLHWDVRGQAVVNVLGLHIQPAGLVNQTTANAIATDIRSALSASNLINYQHTATHLVTVGVRDLRQANLPEYVGVMTQTAGLNTGEPLVLSTALVVTLRTAFAGKSYRGRVYLPVDGDNAWDGAAQAYTSLAVSAADGFIGNIITYLANDAALASNFHLAVVSREKAVSNVVISHQVRSPINGTQRMRVPSRH
jgi:hypothetical protein